jgi:hypothetical protein
MLTTPPLDLDTFLVAVYCLLDDLYQAEIAGARPGARGFRAAMSDSEVLTVLVLGQWQRSRSEREFLAYVQAHWRAYFPRQLSQSAFNRRARHLGGVLAYLGPRVRQQVAERLGPSAYEVLDGMPVPLLRRCRGQRHRLFGAEAGIGRGGADKDWYYGVEVLVRIDQQGFITGWVEGPAPTEEHWLAEALFRWSQDPTAPEPTAADLAPILGPSHRLAGQRRGPTGPVRGRLSAGRPLVAPVLSDLGLRGRAWRHHWVVTYQTYVLTKDDYVVRHSPTADARERGRTQAIWHTARRHFNGLRQLVETTFAWLERTFGLTFPRARTYWGLLTGGC